MSGDNSEYAPPEPMSNSEVKLLCADDSLGFAQVKVGHRQTPFYIRPESFCSGLFLSKIFYLSKIFTRFDSMFLAMFAILNNLFFAGVAQLVEQLICNQQVAGSTPVTSSEYC